MGGIVAILLLRLKTFIPVTKEESSPEKLPWTYLYKWQKSKQYGDGKWDWAPDTMLGPIISANYFAILLGILSQ